VTRLAKIGLFVLITGTGSVFYLMQTAETINAPNTYKVKAYIDDASGLNDGTRVWVSGVTVGRIREVSLENGRALLVMEISSEVPVYRNAVLRKRTQSMLGNAVVSLDPGSPEAIPVKAGEEIPRVVSSTEMDRAFSAAEQVAQEMESFMKELNSFMSGEGGYKTLGEILTLTKETVDNTNLLVERNLLLLSESLENFSKITANYKAGSARDAQELSAILANTARITERLDRILAEQEEGIDASVASLRGSIELLNESMANIERVTAKIDRGEGNIGKLVHDEKIYERVDRVTRNVDEFVGSAMGMDVQLGFRSEYLTLRGSTKNHAELRLVPEAKPKYYSFGLVDSPEGPIIETETRTQTDLNSDGSIDSDETVYEEKRTNKLKLNAQLARIYGPITIRGGIIENSAGIGLGLQPAKQVKFSTELFEFNQPAAPYLRGYGTYYPLFDPDSDNPLRWFYISGGIDNALLSEKRDYFIGLGLRLTDNDLRAVIPFVPAP
jgi:phospholipid/cholesterol/gamma-HCH transport system substrate-binding protein